jgi:hypothetical protein
MNFISFMPLNQKRAPRMFSTIILLLFSFCINPIYGQYRIDQVVVNKFDLSKKVEKGTANYETRKEAEEEKERVLKLFGIIVESAWVVQTGLSGQADDSAKPEKEVKDLMTTQSVEKIKDYDSKVSLISEEDLKEFEIWAFQEINNLSELEVIEVTVDFENMMLEDPNSHKYEYVVVGGKKYYPAPVTDPYAEPGIYYNAESNTYTDPDEWNIVERGDWDFTEKAIYYDAGKFEMRGDPIIDVINTGRVTGPAIEEVLDYLSGKKFGADINKLFTIMEYLYKGMDYLLPEPTDKGAEIDESDPLPMF